MEQFAHIHVHTEYSLLDGMTRIKELVDKVNKLSQPASVITDHGNMSSIIDHFEYASKMGVKAVAGFEAYVVKDHTVKDKSEAQAETDNKREHLLLLATDNDAYKRLCAICSVGTTDGMYYRPRIDDNVLSNIGTKGIIATSACIAGRIAQRLIKDDYEGAKLEAERYAMLFPGNFYLEIQPTQDLSQVKVNLGIIQLHKELGLPIIATTDAHYLNSEDAKAHEVLLAIQSKNLLSNPNRWKFPGETFYIMSRDEITSAFKTNGHEALDQNIVDLAINTTVDVVDRCNVSFDFSKHYLPKIPIDLNDKVFEHKVNKVRIKKPDFEPTSGDYLRHICQEGLKRKGKTTKEYLDRLNYELDIIESKEYPDYFLIFWDIMDFCRKSDIPIGPARGCFTANNLIMTNDGLKLITDVIKGDKVIDHDGNLSEVIDTLSYDCDEFVSEITAANGVAINCTNDHKIYAIKRMDYELGIRTPSWYAAKDLELGDYLIDVSKDDDAD